MSVKLIGYQAPLNARLVKIHIAAAFAGVKVENVHVVGAIDCPESYAKNVHPLGASPALQTENGYLFESAAIMRYFGRLSKEAIYGTTDFEASQIDGWVDLATSEADPNVFTWFGPLFGNELSAETKKSITAAYVSVLTALESWLEIRTFLVGERISLADIAQWVALDTFLRLAETAAEAYKFKNVYRWYLTVLHHPKVQEGLRAMSHDGLIPAKAKEEKAAPVKKEEPKKEEKPKKKEEAHDDEEPEETFEEKKKPNPLDALPPSNFVMDTWKREYSNKDTRKEAAPWFFANYDPAGFSAYWCNYKYNEENQKLFMTGNLVRGWFQRMDHVRKYGFGVALIVGEDAPQKHEITALWIFRGKGLPAIVTDVDDTELFSWTEIADVNAEAAKITDYLAWDGATFASKPVLEGRAFK